MVDVEVQNSTVSLSGKLPSEQISVERSRLESAMLTMTQNVRNVDLGDLETYNSQVLSLCLCLLRLGEQKGFEVRFQNTPSKLFDMARVGGLEFIFVLEKSDSED